VAQLHGITIVTPSADELAAKREAMLAQQDHVATLSKISPDMVAAVSAEIAAAG
jgi:hypothetical protein